MICLAQDDMHADKLIGKWASHWVVLVNSEADAARFAFGWRRVPPDPAYPLWTDDFSNLVQVLGR